MNEMCGSIELRGAVEGCYCTFLDNIKLSSTLRFQIFGGTGVVLIVCSSISSMHKLATTGLTGLPMVQPWICL